MRAGRGICALCLSFTLSAGFAVGSAASVVSRRCRPLSGLGGAHRPPNHPHPQRTVIAMERFCSPHDSSSDPYEWPRARSIAFSALGGGPAFSPLQKPTVEPYNGITRPNSFIIGSLRPLEASLGPVGMAG